MVVYLALYPGKGAIQCGFQGGGWEMVEMILSEAYKLKLTFKHRGDPILTATRTTESYVSSRGPELRLAGLFLSSVPSDVCGQLGEARGARVRFREAHSC